MAKKKIDWKAYDRSLKQRGSITFLFSEEATRAWRPDPTIDIELTACGESSNLVE